ncbi:DUF421 domain-containing protein [Anaerobacillus arseniciselenatis]|uniref:DUF421 domain-containing protein n=1 Tax=Anaerobacillus arseniciselenatis TaxID=85682 RepID=A0A1S2LRW5_9BACI|nr:DUF421 domain-containing protein [Anaerobacillus arseniciselenatis]OIJ15269.1 DUF421 domain-containing protein [Anaerobacillus arseniciselenatis]
MNDLVHVIIRTFIAFILMMILARLMGKRQITQITYFDYIVGITIGSIAAELTFSPHIRMSNFIVGMVIWAFVPIILSKIELKSVKFRTLMEGSTTTLIKDGQILEKNLKKEHLTIDEMMLLLRKKDIFKISDIQTAILEKNGEITVMKKSELQPITAKDVGLVVEKESAPCIVIMDGNVLNKTLTDYGYTKEWLLGEIKKQGANDFADVFLAQIDSLGNVYVDLFNDKLKIPQMKEKLLVAANIKQLQSNLVNFSLQTENKEAKQMYKTYADQMDKLIGEMAVYLKE